MHNQRLSLFEVVLKNIKNDIMTTIDDILQALNRSDTLGCANKQLTEDANVVVATLKEQLERGEGR